MNPYLSVVIPVYRSERTIGPLVERLQGCLQAIAFEVVLVNDGSPDQSEQVCQQLADTYENVRFIALRRNFGEFNAVLCGLHYVQGQYAVIIDDDFQNPPEAILTLLHTAEQAGFDVVYSRYAQKQHAFYRNIGSRCLNYITTYLLNKPRSLYLSSFKLMNRAIVDEVRRYQGPYPYIDGLIFRATRHVGSVEVPHHARQDGQSNYTWRKLISLTLNVLFGYSALPLRLIMGLGIGIIGLSLLLGVVLFFGALTNTLAVTGWMVVIWIVTGLTGLQLAFLGVVGEYLGKLFLSHSGQPPYVINQAASRIK